MTIQIDNELQGKLYHSIDQVKDVLSKATDRFQTTTQQAKDTLTETTGKAIKAVDIQSAIASSTSNWLQDHPAILHLVQILIWATEHPIISLSLSLFGIAIAWSLIKAIGRLIDKIATSLLQAPLKLIQVVFISMISTLHNLGRVLLKQPSKPLSLQQEANTGIKDKHQQLAEIFTRLEAIQQEQNELLKILKEIIETDQKSLYNKYIAS
ncbi:hypothetical protein Glo7428_0183 [Gloeocapsa sp. PCC 7428]|uniref:hypothetical protein n=1 Tax=Gloeocapsa sp. PCC 7428 TaxID=1173026 RepID=UPI0002A5C03B|nr:hypothetical protein [Gloeocapsa sp. PCC 7428]AFZ28792.1 hypothetical protein Glo7428_0183 [Gloeocapsa sp. PCC 7428]